MVPTRLRCCIRRWPGRRSLWKFCGPCTRLILAWPAPVTPSTLRGERLPWPRSYEQRSYERTSVKRALIGGIGNVLLGDDGVGPYVVRLLESQYSFGNNVELADLGTPALDLTHQIVG